MNLTEKEFRTFLVLAKKALWGGKEEMRRMQSIGLNLTPASFYSSTPLVEDVENSFEYREEASGTPPYLAGGLFDRERIEAFVARLACHAAEIDPPVDGDRDDPAGFFWINPAFSHADAMAYYCVLRELKPQRVLEIGSGYSTLVADMALRANGHGELILVEPYPKPFLRRLPTVSRLIEQPVQAIPEAELVALIDSCQVWFIDSTHTVKTGSDCLYIYLKIMPQVGSDVLCHSHDIYLPYAMPPQMALEKNIFWTEQYLLQAYLLDNPKAQVLFGSAYLHRAMPELSRAFMQGRKGGGGSIWYRLNAPPPPRPGVWRRLREALFPPPPPVKGSGSSVPNRLPASPR